MNQIRIRRLVMTSLALAGSAFALACQSASVEDEVGGSEQELLTSSGVKLWPTSQIPVCWKSDAFRETEFDEFRRMVRVWLAESWSAAANIEFTDWGECATYPSSNHINVQFSSTNGTGATIGHYLANDNDPFPDDGVDHRVAGTNGMTFNRGDLRSLTRDMQQAFVRHEFGHSLGFSHETDRAANPANEQGNTWGTDFDEFSVMRGDFPLSPSDIAGARRAYGGFPDTKLATATRSDGRIEVLYNGTGNVLYHVVQNTPNADWSRPSLLVPEAPTVRAQRIAVGQNSDGRLEVVYIGTDDRVRHTWQYSNGTWSPEYYLVDSNVKAKQISVGRNRDNRLEVIYIGTDDVVRHVYQPASGGWSAAYDLVDSSVKAKRVAVGRNTDGRMEVFLVGTDDVLRHVYQLSGGGWSAAYDLVSNTVKAKELAVGRNADGRLEVFYNGTDDVLRHAFQRTEGGWSGEEFLAASTNKAKQLAVGENQDGRLDVVFIGTDNGLRHIYQKVNGGWSGEEWLISNSDAAKQLAVGRNQDGRLEVFYYGMNDTLYHTYQSTKGGAFGGAFIL